MPHRLSFIKIIVKSKSSSNCGFVNHAGQGNACPISALWLAPRPAARVFIKRKQGAALRFVMRGASYRLTKKHDSPILCTGSQTKARFAKARPEGGLSSAWSTSVKDPTNRQRPAPGMHTQPERGRVPAIPVNLARQPAKQRRGRYRPLGQAVKGVMKTIAGQGSIAHGWGEGKTWRSSKRHGTVN